MIFAVLGSLGGVVAFAGAIYVVLRGAFEQSRAVKDNTRAIDALTRQLNTMAEDLADTREDVAFLKGRANEVRHR